MAAKTAPTKNELSFMHSLYEGSSSGGAAPASDANPKPGEANPKKADAKATASTGGRPPAEPPHTPGGGGAGGGGGFRKWGRDNPGGALILGLTGLLLAIILLFLLNDFFNERNVERLERLYRLPPAQSAVQSQRPSVAPTRPTVTATAKQTVELHDGTTPTLPENARIVLHGPITNMVIVNSASRIKSFSGEFKLVLKADGTRAWTSGFNSKPTPNSMREFINQLPQESEVWIFVPPSSILELTT